MQRNSSLRKSPLDPIVCASLKDLNHNGTWDNGTPDLKRLPENIYYTTRKPLMYGPTGS